MQKGSISFFILPGYFGDLGVGQGKDGVNAKGFYQLLYSTWVYLGL